ncbi:TraB/GumN family protein [Marinobacter sp. M1N3S26]|uniref:TraB/GumN family protein n=1 Tax=unclassified Marinobacter TaxID=83889 RepID=UPI00387B2339
MKKHWLAPIALLLTGTLLWTMALSAHADTSVWKVTKGDHYLYVGGTIHLLSKDDYPLPDGFTSAYQDSDMVVLETDIAALQTTEYQRKILMATTYSGDNSVLQHLSDDTVDLLRDYLEERNIPTAPLFRLKPGMLSMTLSVLELQQLGLTEAGVDQYFRLQALNDGKELGYLESPDQQIQFLVDMGKGQEDELIRHTILEMKQLPRDMESIRTAWRNGDTGKLAAAGLERWVDRFPDLYDMILVDRNRDWIPEIERLLGTGDIELVLFGALHLVGDDGVLALLEDRGYQVEQVDW